MPGIFHLPMSRKNFLGSSAAIVGGLLVGQVSADDDTQAARLALLSDTHIPADPTNEYRRFKPVENLKKIVPQVVASQPQAAILNGDAARLTGEVEDYTVLKTLLQPIAEIAPLHIGLGNHDDRAKFFRVFPQTGNAKSVVNGKHVSVFELAGTRFVVLDSLLYVDKAAGLLGKGQRDWVKSFLDQPDDRPIVFFVHHSLGDGDGDLLDFDRVFELMVPHRKVKAIFYGHSHRYHVEQRQHIYLVNQPAIGYNFADQQPVGWLDATFTPTGVQLVLNAIGGNVAKDREATKLDWARV